MLLVKLELNMLMNVMLVPPKSNVVAIKYMNFRR